MQAHIERLEQFGDRLQRALFSATEELRSLRAFEASELTAEIDHRKAKIESLESEEAKRIEAIEAKAKEYLSRANERKEAAGVELQRIFDEVDKARESLVETQESLLLQEAGIYEYTHPLEDAIAYKSRLKSIKNQYKTLAKENRAIIAATGWTLNGSATEGKKLVRANSKLMLRAYNMEADGLIRTMKPFKLDSSTARLEKTRETIAKLGSTMNMRVTTEYHRLRIEELELTADYLAKAAEERERIREQRVRDREEEKAQREWLREQEKLEKERSHLRRAVAKLTMNGDARGATTLTMQLDEVEAAVEGIKARRANTAAGYVYVISNLGSFGPNMVKIGMTRRLEPMDRVDELGDTSVPFHFDVHALIYSEDARGLEARLHEAFAEQRVNRVNQRREFFYVTPAQVRDALAEFAGEHLLQYTDEAEAYEWRASDGASRAH